MRRLVVLSLFAATGCVFATDFDSFHAPGAASPDGGSLPSPAGNGEAGTPSSNDSGVDGTTVSTPRDGSIPADNVLFRDDFNRANGAVGNGWLEGVPGRYAIANNAVPVNGSGFAYEQMYLYRPAQPEALNIAASIEVTLNTIPPAFPQVHVRSNGGGSDPKCYAIGLPSSTSFFFGRCAPNNDFHVFSEDDLGEKVAVGKTYRLTVAVSGTDPVHIDVKVERRNGDDYILLGHDQTDDAEEARVTTTGMFGISANDSPNWLYDNFVATKL